MAIVCIISEQCEILEETVLSVLSQRRDGGAAELRRAHDRLAGMKSAVTTVPSGSLLGGGENGTMLSHILSYTVKQTQSWTSWF